MATITEAVPVQTEPEYVYFSHDGRWGHKREVLRGSRRKATFSEIPMIDLAGLYSEKLENRRQVANKIANACENVGFFYVKNHGISQELIDATVESNKKFFEKPLEIKMKEHVYKSRNLRGYEPVHGARVDPGTSAGGELARN